MIQIQQLKPSQWKILKEIRLKALKDTPDAFGSTIEKEIIYTEADWKQKLSRQDCKTIIAYSEDSIPVGIAVGAPYGDDAGLFAMWVDSKQRGKGIGSLLIDTIITWAEEKQSNAIRLDVTDHNHAAITLYQAKGFVKTGQKGTLQAPREHIREHQRILSLNAKPKQI